MGLGISAAERKLYTFFSELLAQYYWSDCFWYSKFFGEPAAQAVNWVTAFIYARLSSTGEK